MLKVKIKNIEFSSPIIAASGTFGYGDEVDNFVDLNQIGCVITKSITLEPRLGNPPPRILESKSGMINSIGLSNVGVEKFCSNKLPLLNNMKTNFIISIAGSKIDDYIKVMRMIEDCQGDHVGYEINVSCPNVKQGGMEFGVDGNVTLDLVSRLRAITNKILIIKLSPNVTRIENIALAAENGGADAVSAVNTFIGMSIDYKTGKISLSTKFGGVSGPAIKPLALAKIHKIYNKIDIPIIGMGGISSYKDVIEFMRLGSTMVQIGTLNYRDPSIISNIGFKLELFLKDNEIDSIVNLIGNYYDS
ncbi:MAG: dihydroorotate dehydrogenase B catalytic subunit [Candidatus Marinimicrobia bacterium]|nr:dihydroorotate dehydrogenase B catalytic subunit [Candidatus Neomarinimicrobiota bacterium]